MEARVGEKGGNDKRKRENGKRKIAKEMGESKRENR